MPKSKDILGTILWSRYSFSPNRLKYCGGNSNLELFEYASQEVSDPKLVDILSEFEAAYPYMEFIAHANKIKNPFSRQVVEAYWLGNNLLNNISLNQFYYHLKERFSKRTNPKIFRYLVEKIPQGAKPHHSFHVFEIYQKIGSTRGLDLGPVIETINNCLVSWGKIVQIEDNYLKVEYRPIVLDPSPQLVRLGRKKLKFGSIQNKKIEYKYHSKSFLKNPKIGDRVSIHWNWACDILDDFQLKNLQKWTLWHLNLANLTI